MQLAIVGEKGHQHLEFRNETDRLEDEPRLRHFCTGVSRQQCLVKPLGLAVPRVEEGGCPQAVCVASPDRIVGGLDEVQGILKDATGRTLRKPKTERNAFVDTP